MSTTEDRAATEQEIQQNIADVLSVMAAASNKAARSPDETQLLVVSKTWPIDVVKRAANCGQIHFGESRAQEVLEKAPALPDSLHWHFIGHLQKNKIRKIIRHCKTLHSVDSLELAKQISRIAGEEEAVPEIYVQVNVADDAAKFGFSTASISGYFEEIVDLPNMVIKGLMTIPAFTTNPADSRKHFASLRELRDELEKQFSTPLPGLSMGMSNDYPIAIEEGATVVRVGTAIFGKRSKTPMAG